MDTTNRNGNQADALPPLPMTFAPIYQVSPDATAADIVNHMDLRLSQLNAMINASIGEDDVLEDISEHLRKEYLYACAHLLEEVINLRGLITFAKRTEPTEPNVSA